MSYLDVENIGTSGADFDDGTDYIGAGAVNVLWFSGVDPTGVADSRAGIQAAFDTAMRTITDGRTANSRGGVFFPPGKYLLNSSVILAGTSGHPQAQGKIFGHRGTVLITGSFAGYLFDDPNPDPTGTPSTNHSAQALTIEGINFVNTSTNVAAGCINIQHTFGPGVALRDCNFQGHKCVLLGGTLNDHFAADSIVDNCAFISLGSEAARDTGSIGLFLGSNTRAANCAFQAFDNGVLLGGAQAGVTASRFEVNNYAIRIGMRPDFTAWSASGSHVSNIAFESNRFDIHMNAGSGVSIHGISSQGQQTSGHDSQTSFFYDAGEKVVISAYDGSGTYDLGAVFYINTAPSNAVPAITFIGCGGGLLKNGSTLNMAGCEMYNCHFNGIEFDCTFAQRPTYASLGTKRIFNDAEEKTSGTTLTQVDVGVTAIQGTGSQTVEAMYNGTDWILTAILA